MLSLDGARLFAPDSAAVLGQGEFLFRSGLGYEAIDLPAAGRGAKREYLVFLPDRLYLEPPRPTPGRRTPWVVVDLGAAATRLAPLVERLETLDPQILLDEIVHGAERATSAGTAVVDHVPLSRYLVEVSLHRATAGAGSLPAAIRLALRQAAADAAGAARLRLTVWVGVDGRIAMLRVGPPGSAGLGTVTMALSNYGATMSATPSLPPPSQVTASAALSPAAADTSLAPWDAGLGLHRTG